MKRPDNESPMTQVDAIKTGYGSAEQAYNDDPPNPEEAKPFHVVLRDRSHIPVSLLVFARDEEHAVRRVASSIRQAHEVLKDKVDRTYGTPPLDRVRAEMLVALMDSEGWWECAPVDTSRIVAEVIWASNGGLL